MPYSDMSLPTSQKIRAEKQIIEERTVCYISNFDLEASGWVAEFKKLDTYRQSVVDQLGKYSTLF